MDYLKNINPHIRDKFLTFNEEQHIYTINGDSNYISVTTWVHNHFEKFDADEIINKMMNSKYWYKNKYYGKTINEIKQLWENNRINAAELGTKLHYDIEAYYNNYPQDNYSIEYKYFINFNENNNHLKPYRTEWMIYDEELKIAGSIDMVFINDDNSLMIYDWKRSKNIIKTKSFLTFSNNEVISHIPDTNFWHYSIQLNTYKAIIEKNYNKIINKMVLVCLHPDNNDYIIYNVPNLQDEILSLFNIRRNQLNQLK